MTDRERVGLIGTGLLGTAIAERLLHAGFRVCTYDVSDERSAVLKRLGAETLASTADVTDACRRMIYVPDSNVSMTS
ncbi:MAG: NAD(P)-binding domain-containing protein [Pirellulaceae bacterium]